METLPPCTPVPRPHGVPKAHSGRTPATPTQPDKLVRLRTVMDMTGLGKTSIYTLPDFPGKIVLSKRAVAWRLSEIQNWIATRSAAGPNKTARPLHQANAPLPEPHQVTDCPARGTRRTDAEVRQ